MAELEARDGKGGEKKTSRLERAGCGVLAVVAAVLLVIPVAVLSWQLSRDLRAIEFPVGKRRVRTFVAPPGGVAGPVKLVFALPAGPDKLYYILIY